MKKYPKYVKALGRKVHYGRVLSTDNDGHYFDVNWLNNSIVSGSRISCSCFCEEITEEEYLAAMVLES